MSEPYFDESQQKNLRVRRELKGYSQMKLAIKAHVSVRMIQHYEQGVKEDILENYRGKPKAL